MSALSSTLKQIMNHIEFEADANRVDIMKNAHTILLWKSYAKIVVEIVTTYTTLDFLYNVLEKQ